MSSPVKPNAENAVDASDDPYALLSRDTIDNPYPAYARLRVEAPVYFSAGWNGWLLTRYDLVAAGFRDPRLSSSRSGAFAAKLSDAVREKLEPLRRNLASWALLLDPPDHTRLRALITRAFTPRLAEGLRPRTESLVKELLDAAAKSGQMDAIRDLANPLPVLIIGEMLGVPPEDRHRLKHWSDALAGFIGTGRMTMEIAETALKAIVELEAYFREQIALRRRRPGTDLLSQLIAAEDQGGILGEQELLSTCTMLLFGGHETTTNLIGNGLLALFRHPTELDAVRASPALLPGAVEELLRYDSPVQRMGRVALEDMEVAGTRIPQGDRVFLVLGAAHRDAGHFPDPDRLDVQRADVRHLALGLGGHYCVGAALARIEAQVALGTLFHRFPQATLGTGKLQWLDTIAVRGVASLPVELGPEADVAATASA